MKWYNKIKMYFGDRLFTRTMLYSIAEVLTSDDNYILTELGLPNDVLDFKFSNVIAMKDKLCLIIGSMGDDIIIDIKSGIVYLVDKHFFLAKSLKHFLCQLYVIDTFWSDAVKNERLGTYYQNRRIYSGFLEKQLLEVDSDLFVNDNAYYWGSITETIEAGLI